MGESSAVTVGTRAPDFTLRDGDGREWRLSERRGRVVVLLFYPGDETPVCTRQLCSVRDRWEEYSETGAEVVGISTDSAESHRKFKENRKLPLTLLSDPDARVISTYGVRSWLPGRSARAVFVVDAGGTVRYRKVEPLSIFRPKDEETLRAVREAQESAGA